MERLNLASIFKIFDKGDRITVIRELTCEPKFPKQIQGRSGVIESKRGSSYLVKIKDLNKEKTYIIHPVHLKKLK